jgi:hypothetical protein
VCPEPIPRPLPEAALAPAEPLPALPPGVTTMSPGEALRTLLDVKIEGDALYHELTLRHAALRRWILENDDGEESRNDGARESARNDR